MKIRKFLYLFIACALVLTSCPSPIVSPGLSDEEELQKATEQADEKSQDLLGHVSDALTVGDSSGLQQYLAEEDENGELAALLAQYGVTVSGKAFARGFSLGEGPSAADLEDGDTLVFRGDGSTWQNQLMRLLVPGFYHHAGTFDAELAGIGVACVISATIDSDDNGLCFQTLEELNSTNVAAARLRYYSSLPGEVAASIDNYIGRTTNDTTYYAFLHLSLDPVSRFDERLWYCSKVPWRVYWDAYEESAKVDIEGSSFYDDPDRFEEMKDSYVYQIYLWLLQRILPRRLRGLAEERAEAKLREVLSELVSPDELRSSARVISYEHWGDTEPDYFLPQDVPVTGVSVEPESLSLVVGETQTLTATVFLSNATNQSVSWSSNNEGVATVDDNGLVTAVAAGAATITVTTEEGPYTATCAVEVRVPVTGVTLAPKELELVEGGATGFLTVTITPPNATNKSVTWSSSDELVAVAGPGGIIYPMAPGTAEITVTTEDGGFSDFCEVTVIEAEGNLLVTFTGEPAAYFDGLAEAQCRLIVVGWGEDPEVLTNRVVDQTFTTTAGVKAFEPIPLYAPHTYDVYCWFDVGPDEGMLDDGDHSVWRDGVDIYAGQDNVVDLEHQVLTGTITWGPEWNPLWDPEWVSDWTEIHLWVALVVPYWVVEPDPDPEHGHPGVVDFMDLEDAGLLDEDTSYLGFTYRGPSNSVPAENSIGYALDITGLAEILNTAGPNPDYSDEPYNPCYLFAFIEPALVPGEEGALSEDDILGFFGLSNLEDEPDLVMLLPGQGLWGCDISLLVPY